MSTSSFAGARRALPYAVAVVGIIVLALSVLVFTRSSGFGYDFRAYDGAARRIAAGQPLYAPDTAEAWNAGRYDALYVYPPPLAVSLLPLVAVAPPDVATLGWFALRICLLIGGCLLLPVRRELRIGLLGIAAMSFPVLYDLNLGNVSVVLFFLVAVAWRWIDRPIASVALAASVALRLPFALVGLWWIARRAWIQLAWWLAAGLAMVAVSAVIVGPGSFWDYGSILRGLRTMSTAVDNLRIADSLRVAGLAEPAASAIGALAIVVSVAATAWAGLRRDRETGLIVATTATLIAAPFLHPHYLVALLVPAAFLADRAGWWWLALPLLGWLPGELLPFVALGATIAPLVLPRSRTDAQPATSSGTRLRRAPSS